MPYVCLYPILSPRGKENIDNQSKSCVTKMIMILNIVKLSKLIDSMVFAVSLFYQLKDLSNYCNCKNISTLERRRAM